MILKQFYFNNVLVRLVGVHPETGIAFYVNNGRGGVIGVRVLPNGTKRMVKATTTKLPQKAYSHGSADYLKFQDAFGRHKSIFASRAVYSAWVGEIPSGMTIDHIDGCTTDNRFENLRTINGKTNSRDGGFLRKLKKAGFNPVCIDRAILLRYFDRMAVLRAQIPYKTYRALTKTQLRSVLYDAELKIEN